MLQECRAGLCTDPCLGFEECGTNAECVASNHLATCQCPQGFKVRLKITHVFREGFIYFFDIFCYHSFNQNHISKTFYMVEGIDIRVNLFQSSLEIAIFRLY